jgi:hypothetical protein
MVTISAKARINPDGTLDLRVPTGLPETDVDGLIVLEPRNHAPLSNPEWPDRYFEETFGSLRDNPIARETPPPFELHR